uniref:Uncharacterized protein n=1 Tax=Sphaerodactylus townsendi TaxID=933632 RepID=A0ACB8EP75_9SAUR
MVHSNSILYLLFPSILSDPLWGLLRGQPVGDLAAVRLCHALFISGALPVHHNRERQAPALISYLRLELPPPEWLTMITEIHNPPTSLRPAPWPSRVQPSSLHEKQGHCKGRG